MIHNVTPWRLGPNGYCLGFLETGDVLEIMPNLRIRIACLSLRFGG